MKIIVYTCITGGYDKLIEIEKKEHNIEYYCFTNDKNLKSRTWNVKYIEEDLDNLTLTRKIKILPNLYLPKHDVSIWVDGAVKILKPISQFIHNECDLENYDMVAFSHQVRDCIYDEINACALLRKETLDNCKNIKKFLVSEKYPKHNGLIESTVLIRKQNNEIEKLMNMWYKMVSTFSRRDQLSFNYCLYKKPVKIKMLNIWVFDNLYFKHIGHNKNIYLDYRIDFDEDSFDIKNVIDGRISIVNDKAIVSCKCKKDTNSILLYLYNDIGSVIDDISVNIKPSSYTLINSRNIDNKFYFYDTPVVKFHGNFKRNDKLDFTFSIKRNSHSILTEEIYKKDLELKDLYFRFGESNGKIDELELLLKDDEKKITELNDERNYFKRSYYEVINSKTWRFANKLRRFKRIFRKK